MNAGWRYLDSSAMVKMVVVEAESEALQALIADWQRRISSSLARVEVPRAVRRLSPDPAVQARAERLVDDTDQVPLDQDVLRNAARLAPVPLRSLDAIHLASALSLGASLGGIVTYDDRLAEAARTTGCTVLQPR